MRRVIRNTDMEAIFDLGEKDAAIIFREDGSEELAIPAMDEDTMVEETDPTYRLMVLLMLLHDKEIYARGARKLEEGCDSK
jgi:hypothetical protein